MKTDNKIIVVANSKYTHPEIGPINLRVYPTSKKMSARWRDGVLHVCVPPGTTPERYDTFLKDFKDKILATKPAVQYYVGQTVDAPLADFTIVVDEAALGKEVRVSCNTQSPLRGKRANYNLIFPTSALERLGGIESHKTQRFINDALVFMATRAVREIILPIARAKAAELGCRVNAWDVKHVNTWYGQCTSRGKISFSSRLIFMPLDLAEYIICHELAHLTEMNHSPRFHALCNEYCGGREAEFRARLKKFRAPIY